MAATRSPSSRRLPVLAKYDVLEELGHGGMATVYRAHDKRLGRDVAVKVIHPHLRDSAEVKARFFVEAQAVAKLRHANIVEVYDVSGEGEHEQYLVVELLRGRTLRSLLREHGALPPEIAASLALELLSALAHAHAAGVVHRDVKPENVILEHALPRAASTPVPAGADAATTPSGRPPRSGEQPGERVTVKLTDFGIAKLLDAQGVTSTGQVLGSPAHMAPEQIEGGDVDERADVFGLGVLLYECMVGALPFRGNNPAQVLRRVLDGVYAPAEHERSEIGRTWSAILDRALARQARDRFAGASEMREAIAGELHRLGVTAPRAELEAWLDGPAAYAEAHRKAMIAKLCERGAEGRRAGDALAAAADYNRALAYAPADAHLLKIVSGMNRAESRARFLRRGGPALAGAVGLGVIAFFVARAVRERPPIDAIDTASSTPSVVPERAAAARSAEPAAPARSAPSASAARAVPPAPAPIRATGSASPVPPSAHRTITLARVAPPFGVLVAVDDQPPSEASANRALSVSDAKTHTLTFSCVEDLCEPLVRVIAAGDADESLEIDMRIKPCALTIIGDPTKSYAILEMPQLSPHVGAPTAVPMHGKSDSVHVKDLLTGETREVSLVAGKSATADFSGSP